MPTWTRPQFSAQLVKCRGAYPKVVEVEHGLGVRKTIVPNVVVEARALGAKVRDASRSRQAGADEEADASAPPRAQVRAHAGGVEGL